MYTSNSCRAICFALKFFVLAAQNYDQYLKIPFNFKTRYILYKVGWHTVKLRAVDRSTINFGIFLVKGHRPQYIGIKCPFINSLKILGRATNRDVLLLAT